MLNKWLVFLVGDKVYMSRPLIEKKQGKRSDNWSIANAGYNNEKDSWERWVDSRTLTTLVEQIARTVFMNEASFQKTTTKPA